MRGSYGYTLLALSLIAETCVADGGLIPERRKAQFQTEFGYAIFPYPYSLPGLGSGLSLVGGAMNIKESHLDVYGLIFGGDVKGEAIGVGEMHIIPKTLILELGTSRINKAAITNYSSRGMNAGRKDYTLLEIADTSAIGGRAIATFLDRRLEFFLAYYKFKSQLDSIRDRDGNAIITAENSSSGDSDARIVGMTIDLTDDHSDPRQGILMEISHWYNPGENGSSEYQVWDISLSAYVPLGKRSTWAFNYFQSDADVSKEGDTTRVAVEDRMGLDCSTLSDTHLQTLCFQSVDNQIANNKYGTAGSLGGFNRLRSYPEGRYTGAHIRFFGSEVRWNLTDEFTPFNIYVIKDIRTAIQVAFFFEIGTVADVSSDLYDVNRSAYGVGIRMITASGVVFRGDLAFGDEGVQPNIFIGYPWEL